MTAAEKLRDLRIQIALDAVILACLVTASIAIGVEGSIGLLIPIGALIPVMAYLLTSEVRGYIATRKDTRP